MSTHLFVTDCHATPEVNNNRALMLSRFIAELKQDVVIVGGDTGDFSSLCSYDKGKKSFQGRTYRADVNAHNDFQEKLWHYVKKAKKKLPHRITLIGNHEQRIERAIEVQPELEGVISYRDLDLERWYDVVVPYNGSTPGIVEVGGVNYGHYMVSGVAGRAISGENQAGALVNKRLASCCVGHSHILDYSVKTQVNGRKVMGLVGGCYMGHSPAYAGEAARLWWRGVTLQRNVENGMYDLECISLLSLQRTYW